MVVEIRTKEDMWVSFASERLPTELDDAIKAKHSIFYNAAAKISPEQLLASLPMTFPMTHPYKGFPGIARYPVSKRENEGQP